MASLEDCINAVVEDQMPVTTEPCSRNRSNSKASSTASVASLLDVTSTITTANPASEASTRVGYPVTETELQVGDRAVLTKEGNNRPPNELKVIGTVKAIQEQKVVIHCEGLGDRVFPRGWLERYA